MAQLKEETNIEKKVEAQNQQQQEAEEEASNVPQIKVNLHFLGKLFLPLDISGNDNLGEIKAFLTEQTILNIYTNYHFQYKGEKLSEFVEFQSLEIPEHSQIDIKLDPLDERSARLHVRKVNNILNNPQIFQAYLGNQQQQTQLQEQQKKDEELELQNQQNELEQAEKETTQKSKKSSDDISQNAETEQNEKKTKKKAQKNNKNSEEQQQQLDDSDSEEENRQEIININEALSPSLANKFLTTDRNPDNFPLEQSKVLQLVTFVNFSGFNPPPSFRRLKGDLFYLIIRTLENIVYHVTASPKGFYVNKSNMRYFDAEPMQNAKYYISLLDMLQALSPQFKENFTKQISEKSDSTLTVNNLEQSFPQLYKYGINWLSKSLSSIKPEVAHEWNQNRSEQQLSYCYGFDPQGLRDWNEELQACRDLPKGEFLLRLNRDKALIKTYSDFTEAAIQGAKAVVEGNLTPINPIDPSNQHVYLYNNIFFSFALDNSDNFRQECGIELSPTVSTSNCDLRNLKYLHKLDIPDMNVLNTVLIDYRGLRVIAQSIIPGILASDQNSCSEYGSIDDGKNIAANPEFHTIMKDICKHFYLDDDVKFKDAEGKEFNVAASIEVKGIRGTDKRKYMLDLMRLSPRDLNYEDSKEHASCVLRQELITNYIVQKNYDQFDEEDKKNEEKENLTDIEKQTKYLTKQQRFQDWLQNNESKFSLKVNSSISTKVSQEESEKTEQQAKDLKKIAEFITEKAIPNLVNDLTNNPDNGKLSDSQSIQEAFHIHGINMRYLGKVCEKVNEAEYPQVKIVLERVILVKSLKHVFRKIMRETETLYISNAIAHVLNCVFSPQYLQTLLNEDQIQFDLNTSENNSADILSNQSGASGNNKKKQKKNKKKSEQNGSQQQESNLPTHNFSDEAVDLIQIELPEILKKKPSEIWEEVNYISKKRYNYQILKEGQSFFKFTNYNRLAAIRDLCLSVGLQIESQDYNFKDQEKKWVEEQQDSLTQTFKQAHPSQQKNQPQLQKNFIKNQMYKFLPFKGSNIIDIQPIVKGIDHISQDAKFNIDMTQKLHGEGKINELLECCNSALQILQNLYGPIHKDIATCYQRLANIHYHYLRDIEQSVYYCRQAIKVYKKCVGEVNFQTALAYQNLGYYYFCKRSYNKCYKYMFKSLLLLSIIGGESHPDTQLLFTNLAMFFGENEQQQASLSCFFEFLDRTILIYGKDHIKLAQCYQNIAIAHYEQIQDMKKAIEFQEKAVSILQKHIKDENDLRFREASIYLAKFNQALIERKNNNNIKVLSEGNGQRQFGQSKGLKTNSQQQQQQQQQQQKKQQSQQQQKQENQENSNEQQQQFENNNNNQTQESQNEREQLMKKFQQAKLQKQYLRNSNMSKYMHQQQQAQQQQQ